MREALQVEHLPVGQMETLRLSLTFDLVLSQHCSVWY